jgi:hypothetical protein
MEQANITIFMRKWNDYTDDDIKDEITLIRKGLESVIPNVDFMRATK